MVATQNIDTLGPNWTFSLLGLKDHKCYSMFDLNSRPD